LQTLELYDKQCHENDFTRLFIKYRQALKVNVLQDLW